MSVVRAVVFAGCSCAAGGTGEGPAGGAAGFEATGGCVVAAFVAVVRSATNRSVLLVSFSQETGLLDSLEIFKRALILLLPHGNQAEVILRHVRPEVHPVITFLAALRGIEFERSFEAARGDIQLSRIECPESFFVRLVEEFLRFHGSRQPGRRQHSCHPDTQRANEPFR